METISVLLADDHTIFREGLRALLGADEGIRIVGEAANSTDAIELATTLKPEIVVMDIMMPDFNGLQATIHILRRAPSVKVIVLSMSSDEEFVAQAIAAGVRGYLVKQTAANELLSAIREVHRGNAFFSPAVSRVLLETHQYAPARKPVGLTVREREVLQLVAAGKTSKEIAFQLCISVKTVDKYRGQIMDKLNIHDVAGLTRHAVLKGILK